MRVAGLALPVVIGVTVTVTSCGSASTTASTAVSATSSASSASGAAVSGSPTASAVASSSPAAVPAGYKRVGGAAQGISIGAPTSWVAFDLTKVTKANVQADANKISINGMSSASLLQDLKDLQKLHAVALWDVNSAADNPQRFPRDLNAYCFQAAGAAVGAEGVPQLKSNAADQFASQGMTNITQQDLTIGGLPGAETSYSLASSTVGTIHGAQLEVVAKPDDVCVVTESYVEGQSGGNVLSVAAATAEFP